MRFLTGFLGLVAAVAVSQATPPMEDNPTYVAWVKYKPGTSVTLKITETTHTTLANGKDLQPPKTVESVLVQTLKEVLPDGVSLEGTTTRQMDDKPQVATNRRVFPARSPKAAVDATGLVAGADVVLKLKESKSGVDNVEFKGEKLTAAVVERTAEPANVPGTMVTMTYKLWYVPKIPGGVVRLEVHTVEKQGEGELATTRDVTKTVTLVEYSVVSP